MQLRAPVQVLYSRIDEMKFVHFLPAGRYALKAAIQNQTVTAVHLRTVHPSVWIQQEPHLISENGDDHSITDDIRRYPYEFPTLQYEQHIAEQIQIRVGWWRGTYANIHSFVMESWIDELAANLKKDPLDYRLSLLQNDQALHTVRAEEVMDKMLAKRVLQEVADLSGWRQKRKKGLGKGIAWCFTFFESYAAIVAEVRVRRKTELYIDKIYCAVDCGIALNPNMIKAQIEGGIIWSLSALKASVSFDRGAVVENSFGDYPILTYAECPEIIVHIMDSDRPVSGVGELSNIPTFAAVCNAIFDACGQRIRKLPLEQLKIQSS